MTSLTSAELAPLEAADIHSVSAPVDATNLANLEFGQPTHCFDADTIVGPIRIRQARPGEQAWPLFAEEKVEVPAGAIVIADDEKVLAIAGVIGCEESKATESTTRILLESAAFDPVAVRKASRALNIHTDSSARFERGSDASQVLVGAARVVGLLEGHGWTRVGETGMVGDWTDERRTIEIDTAAAANFLGIDLSDDESAERLRRYGFEVTVSDGHLSVIVPPHRVWDVEFPADLYEELAKSIGYNDTPSTLPPVDMGALPTAGAPAAAVPPSAPSSNASTSPAASAGGDAAGAAAGASGSSPAVMTRRNLRLPVEALSSPPLPLPPPLPPIDRFGGRTTFASHHSPTTHSVTMVPLGRI